jgi:hypothetical protein
MMQHECFLAYAPRGAGLLCAVAYVSGEPDIVGWFVGAKGRSYPSAYFRVENFFAAEQKRFWATAGSDIYGGWRYDYARGDSELDPAEPVGGEFAFTPESVCETDRDNAASRHIGQAQHARAMRKMRRRVAPAWYRQESGARGARCSNPRMRPTFASGRSRSRTICDRDIRGGRCRSDSMVHVKPPS